MCLQQIQKINRMYFVYVCVCVLRFVYLVFAHYELELCDPEAVMPEVEASRYGFGMLQPAGDLDVRYKLRASL